MAQSPPSGGGGDDLYVVLRVIKARMLRSFEMFGKMDPQATVHWAAKGRKAVEIARTQVDWNGHLAPKWEHTCLGQPYPGAKSGVSVEFKVLEADVIGLPTFCGSACVTLDELVELPSAGGKASAGSMSEPLAGPIKELALVLPSKGGWVGGASRGETTGHITVQAILMRRSDRSMQDPSVSRAVMDLTRVDPDMFDTPVERLQVSGGTAPFFALRLKNPRQGQSKLHFIGKDLSHATDEINFYEMALQCGKGNGELATLLKYCPEYAGVFTATEKGTEEQRELLVMRNLKDGQKAARMLDIKMGQKTGQAGWQGKSRSAALRQSIVDGITNSNCEGFRLEGFDHRPPALLSMDPLLDIGSSKNPKIMKKAHRVLLQRMQAAEMMMHYLDVHRELACPDDTALRAALAPSELTELVLHESVKQLCSMAVTCRKVPVPQKWIGSSVALGFDCAELPARSQGAQDAVRKSTLVAIFDWGRSELNTLENHLLLSEKLQKDRSQFWRYYVGGVDRLAWETARAYRHRYTMSSEWSEVIFVVHDFDSMTSNDFLGKVRVPLQACGRTTKDLFCPNGSKRGELTFSISWRPYPSTSRLKGAWQVTVSHAARLPPSDGIMILSSSDPFVEVVAVAEDGSLGFRQMTEIKVKTLDPRWDETFEIPVMAAPDGLAEALSSSGMDQSSFGCLQETDMFPVEEAVLAAANLTQSPGCRGLDQALRDFVDQLDQAALVQIRREGGDTSTVAACHDPSLGGGGHSVAGDAPLEPSGVIPEIDADRDEENQEVRQKELLKERLKEPETEGAKCGCGVHSSCCTM